MPPPGAGCYYCARPAAAGARAVMDERRGRDEVRLRRFWLVGATVLATGAALARRAFGPLPASLVLIFDGS